MAIHAVSYRTVHLTAGPLAVYVCPELGGRLTPRLPLPECLLAQPPPAYGLNLTVLSPVQRNYLPHFLSPNQLPCTRQVPFGVFSNKCIFFSSEVTFATDWCKPMCPLSLVQCKWYELHMFGNTDVVTLKCNWHCGSTNLGTVTHLVTYIHTYWFTKPLPFHTEIMFSDCLAIL